jgi:hypothetical protein
VVRDVSTGRGIAFLQETSVFHSFIDSALRGVGATLQGGFNPLSVIAAVQNHQIKQRLAELQSSLAVIQNLQFGTLAVSGLGIGLSVAGFAMMLRKLNDIKHHLDNIELKIDRITADRRADEIRMIFADVGTQINSVETLSARSNKFSSAEAAERALSTSAGRLEAFFQQQSSLMRAGPVSPADMDMLWSLGAAIRLCHEAGLRALFSVDELLAAQQLAELRALRVYDLTHDLAPDALARLSCQDAKDAASYTKARRLALPQAETLVQGLRDSVASISSQSELARTLIEKNISGSDYIKEIEKNNSEPLLVLPT